MDCKGKWNHLSCINIHVEWIFALRLGPSPRRRHRRSPIVLVGWFGREVVQAAWIRRFIAARCRRRPPLEPKSMGNILRLNGRKSETSYCIQHGHYMAPEWQIWAICIIVFNFIEFHGRLFTITPHIISKFFLLLQFCSLVEGLQKLARLAKRGN